ncbi:Uncharacterised protein [Pandoraea pulmonicola]|nr:Uncharacterised protein [Pandoraea pulmonicola]
MPSNSTQRPPPPETPPVIRQALKGTWDPGMPSGSTQQPPPLATLEITSNSGAEKRSAPQDANSRDDAVLMPPPAKIPRQKIGTSKGYAKITVATLQRWAALGPTGIQNAGGLDGLASRDNVSPDTLRHYLRANGNLTPLGESRLHPDGRMKITDAMLQAWKDLGRAGIEAAGGLDGLAKRENVSFAALKNYLRADGTLTRQGRDRLNPSGKVETTDAMLQAWKDLGRAGIEAAGGLEGLAKQNNVSFAALRNDLRVDGTPTWQGQDRLNPGRKGEISDDMLRQWAALGRAGIEAAGGLDGLAKQNNVSAGAVRKYLRVNGALSPYGRDRLNPDGKGEITGDLLRQWAALGPAWIQDMGGLEGLARRYNVSFAALRNYLRVDGSLTQLGEERLNPKKKAKITDDMLRRWAALGQVGIEAAGGLKGLARQNDVSSAALRNYLHADGTLTQQGQDRLRKADMLPM